jgi:hypothetical protein
VPAPGAARQARRPFRLRPAGRCPCAGRPDWHCRSAACSRCQSGALRRRWVDHDRRLPLAVRRLVPRLPAALLTTRIGPDVADVAPLPAFLRRLGDGLRYLRVDLTWFTAVEIGMCGAFHTHQVVLAGRAADLAALHDLAAGHAPDLFPAAGTRQVRLTPFDHPYQCYSYVCKIGRRGTDHIPRWLPIPWRCRWRAGYRACLRRLTARIGGA